MTIVSYSADYSCLTGQLQSAYKTTIVDYLLINAKQMRKRRLICIKKGHFYRRSI